MTMISSWLQSEEPDYSDPVGFYFPGRINWFRGAKRTHGPIAPREIICQSMELNLLALVETEVEEEFGSID